MSMVTRCPSCNTLFRVTPQQLQAHHGQVRCGRCVTVFDGFSGLVTLPDETPSEMHSQSAAERAAAPAADGGATPRTDAQLPQDAGASAAPEPAAQQSDPAGFEFEPIERRDEPAARPAFEPVLKPPPARPDTRTESVVTSASAVRADALFLEQAHAKRRRGLSAWTAGSILMLLALAGQAGYFYRGQLAASYPGFKPVIAWACELIQCSVPLPQRPKLINIEASDLQSIDPARPGVIQLTATLRNHAGYELGYPALDLVLTNTKEHTLARRIFLPEEYLDKGRDVNAGFPANAEITVRLDLDTGELGPAGFRLGLLPAPAR